MAILFLTAISVTQAQSRRLDRGSDRVFQYMVNEPFTPADGKAGVPVAYLWISPASSHVRGLILAEQNVAEETFVEHPAIRRACAAADLAIVWFCPPFTMTFDQPASDGAVLQQTLDELASVSGYPEIAQAPWLPFGHSASGFMAQRLADYLPQRTIAVLLFKSTLQPQLKNLRSIPMAWVTSTFMEWDQNKRNLPLPPSLLYDLERIQRERAVDGWPISFLQAYGSGHFECSDAEAGAMGGYITTAAVRRLPQTFGDPLRPIDLNAGWVADFSGLPPGHRPRPVRAGNAPAELKSAPWYFDRALAETADEMLPVEAKGNQQFPALVLPARHSLPFVFRGLMQWTVASPEADGISFSLAPSLLDTLPDGFKNAGAAIGHAASGRFDVTRSCGSVEPVGVGGFRIALDRSYPRDNWLVVSHGGDASFRPSVQPVHFILAAQTNGQPNFIQFEPIADQRVGTVEVPLKAIASSGMKVRFFVRAGPAVVSDDRLIFTALPPRSAYPVKVTVAAWQWGRQADPPVQTAPLVERTFLILKPTDAGRKFRF